MFHCNARYVLSGVRYHYLEFRWVSRDPEVDPPSVLYGCRSIQQQIENELPN
jgi:hypothetical protein